MKILLAGGGTAGHVEPAIAVAKAWMAKHPLDEILFLGTTSGLENSLIPQAGFRLAHIPKVSITRKVSPSLLSVPFQLIKSVFAASKILKGVDCAVGFGGYVSGPLYLAAYINRIPFVIHEQNAKPGWANILGAHLTRFKAISYPVTARSLSKAALTGLPLRQDVLEILKEAGGDWKNLRQQAKLSISAKYGLEPERPLIFIFGGSQGSRALNAVVEQSRQHLEKLQISTLHGVGRDNHLPDSTPSYRAVAYIDDMAECYLAADLLISRSGAVTCAEASALVKYSLFIPLPVGNGEQALNARSLVDAGRGEIQNQIDFTSEWLNQNIERLLNESQSRPDEGDASNIRAVDRIVEIVELAAGVR